MIRESRHDSPGGVPVCILGREPFLFRIRPQFHSGTARRLHTPFVQAEGLLDSSRRQVRLRGTPPPDTIDFQNQFDPYRVGWLVAGTVPWATSA